MNLGSIYASQAGRKVMGGEARDLAVQSSSGEQAFEVAASSGRGSKLWMRQQALDAAASFGGGSKLWRR